MTVGQLYEPVRDADERRVFGERWGSRWVTYPQRSDRFRWPVWRTLLGFQTLSRPRLLPQNESPLSRFDLPTPASGKATLEVRGERNRGGHQTMQRINARLLLLTDGTNLLSLTFSHPHKTPLSLRPLRTWGYGAGDGSGIVVEITPYLGLPDSFCFVVVVPAYLHLLTLGL